MNAPASPSHDIACMTTSTKTRKLPKRGLSVWRRQSQFSAALGFALEPFIDAVKPISHHGEDGVVGRRLSASRKLFSLPWQSRLPTRSHVYSTPATLRVRRSAGSFQLLCHGEQPGDGIPVSCSTGLLQGPIQQWRKFRASYAVGKIDVEFAVGLPQFLGTGFHPEKRFPSVRARICCQEGDEKLAWIEVAARCERVPVYYISQVRRGAKNHAGAKAEAALDLVLDPRRESRHVAFFGLENDVAALDIGCGVLQSEGLIEGAERVHLD